MPYITKDKRAEIDKEVDALIEAIKKNNNNTSLDGVLNYTITRMLVELYEKRYHDINAAIGVLECAKQEFYRRQAAPYEDVKTNENGDVYPTPIRTPISIHDVYFKTPALTDAAVAFTEADGRKIDMAKKLGEK